MDDRVINNYRIIRQIGHGGMGIVYLAQHEVIERQVAIKLLRNEFIGDEALVTRFFNEARAAAAAKHPGIVEILDVGYDQEQAFIMMELIEGKTLGKYLREFERLSAIEAIDLTRQVACALSAAHSRSVVHRDLKPSNIMLVPSEDPLRHIIKVFDFGIAKLFGENSSHTRTGILMGTPTYMSPEQCKGAGRVDLRSDLYSLGCILYLMLTGQRVFKGEGEGEIIAKHIFEKPIPPAELAPVPAPLNAIVLRLLEKEPDARFQTTQDLIEALDHAVAALSVSQHSPTSVTITTKLPLPPIEALTPTPRARQMGLDAMQPDLEPSTGTPLATQGRTIYPEPTAIRKRRSVTAVLTLLAAVGVLSLVLYLRTNRSGASTGAASEGATDTAIDSIGAEPAAITQPAAITEEPAQPSTATATAEDAAVVAAQSLDAGIELDSTDADVAVMTADEAKATKAGTDTRSASSSKDASSTKAGKGSKGTKTSRDSKTSDDAKTDKGPKKPGPRTLNPFE